MKSPLFCLALTVIAFFLTASRATSFGQKPSILDEMRIAKHEYHGIQGCVRCHARPQGEEAGGVLDRVSLTESTTWKSGDKHSVASTVLLEKRSILMGELLGKNVLDLSTGCVQCHASNYTKEIWADPQLRELALQEGVGCEVCHGASGDSEKTTGWYDLHHVAAIWQEKTDKQKIEAGLVPLHVSTVRTEVCLSCHLGSRRENRVITHEMYAAGHPPLAGFELEAFAEKMPRHWRYDYEKPAGPQDSFVRTRHTLVAAIASLRMSVDLAAGPSKDRQDAWPELARMDCFACHHDLRSDGWRKNRPRFNRAGKMQLYLGCIPLMQVAARAAEGDNKVKQLDSILRRVNGSFNTSAFGDVSEMAATEPIGKKIRAWCHDLEATLQRMPIDQLVGKDVLTDILRSASRETHDYDTARQLSGAFATIAEELDALNANTGKPNSQSALLGLLKNAFDLQPVETNSGRNENRVETRYSDSLKHRDTFNPLKFSKIMKSLSKEDQGGPPR